MGSGAASSMHPAPAVPSGLSSCRLWAHLAAEPLSGTLALRLWCCESTAMREPASCAVLAVAAWLVHTLLACQCCWQPHAAAACKQRTHV